MGTWRKLVALVSASVLLASCSTGSASPSAALPTTAPSTAAPASAAPATSTPAASSLAPASIVFWAFGSDEQTFPDGTRIKDFFQGYVDQFQTANPGVKIEFAMKGAESGGTTLYIDTAVAAGSPPDVYWDSISRLSKFGLTDQLVDLSGIVTDQKKTTIDPATLALTTTASKIWGLFVASDVPNVLMVNRAAFKKAGAENLLPSNANRDWTTDEFLKAAQAVNKPPNQYAGFLFAKTPSYDSSIFAFLAQFGAERLPSGQCKGVLDGSPEAIAGNTFLKSLIDQKLIVPGSAAFDDADLDAALLAGRTTMAGGGWYEQSIVQAGVTKGELKAADFDPIVVNYPSPDGTDRKMTTPGGFAVGAFKSADAAREAAAVSFINFMSSPDVVLAYSTKSGLAGGAGIPLIRPAGFDANTFYKGNADALWVFDNAKKRGFVNMGFTCGGFNDVRLKWAELRQAIWSGQKTVEQATQDFVTAANAIYAAKN